MELENEKDWFDLSNKELNDISWNIIHQMFEDNPYLLVNHHLTSYNHFFKNGIFKIFKDNNPIRFKERIDAESKSEVEEKSREILIYMGGKEGNELYFGKPVIYDDNYSHYMYPNEARLRNMTYGTTIHYNVECEMIQYDEEGNKNVISHKIEKIYLGRFPIMLHSDLCILKDLPREVRYNMGECKNDLGGYFIIQGKEKTVVTQEKFSDNMLYIRKHAALDKYLFSVEIKSVSEDPSKPIRYTSIRIVAPSESYTNLQLVVDVPNVRTPVPLFILLRALGFESDKKIIQTCILDMEKNKRYIPLFIPSIHDANLIFTQQNALEYIALLTKRKTISGVYDILINYFLPHIGETNLLDKAYFIGFMVFKLLKVYVKAEPVTDRDNFKFKRVELSGVLIYDLFREYYLIQKQHIALNIDKLYYYHSKESASDFSSLILNNTHDIFKNRIVETGFQKAFKGNWGATPNTKRPGVIQDLNRLSWNSFMNHLRKVNLPLDASAKVVGPRLLHPSQWGIIDYLDTPDGGNIGLHKHLAIGAVATTGSSTSEFIKWIMKHFPILSLSECNDIILANYTKVIINGNWIGTINNPIENTYKLQTLKRNGVISIYTTITFSYTDNIISIYTDAGRLMRPIYYIDNITKLPSFLTRYVQDISTDDIPWKNIVYGFDDENKSKSEITMEDYSKWAKTKSIVEYVDADQEENMMILNLHHTNIAPFQKKFYTNIEIHPSLCLGMLGNLIPFPESNQLPRNLFSCVQSKQGVSLYSSNYVNRFDKAAVVMNEGQIPLTKTRYLNYFNRCEQPYGVNTIVAIMSLNGYNVEDSIIVNEGSIKRGLFRTSYFSTYETKEDIEKGEETYKTIFSNTENKNIKNLKRGADYNFLDENGLIKPETVMDDKIVMVGRFTSSVGGSDDNVYSDSSILPKKGQLGVVDKVVITEGEEGYRYAKVKIREERMPNFGDKLGSRIGQKGTVGCILSEADMPYTENGLKPDLIINPHAIPSRMTIGQLYETVLSKIGCMIGGYGDCTAMLGQNADKQTISNSLTQMGFHSSGNEVMYNGMNGLQLNSDIFIGPTYYMRMKHMTKDKINYRGTGPRTVLTRQSVDGRANDGGLRIGEMERDALIGNGMSHFLSESFLKRGDEYYVAICNQTGMIAIYNEAQNIFLSPFADGPIQFASGLEKDSFGMRIKTVSRFGRSFSIVKIPYSLKLLIQELQTMNVVTRIITDDNISQLSSLSYSDTFQSTIRVHSTESLETSMKQYLEKLRISYLTDKKFDATQHIGERVMSDEMEREIDKEQGMEERLTDSSEYIVPKSEERSTDSSEYIVPNYDNELPGLKIPTASYENSQNSPEYAPYSPAPIDLEYDPNATPLNIFNSPKSPNSPNSPEYAPYTPPPRDFENNSPTTPYNINSSSEKRIPSPHTPNYPPPGRSPILGGNIKSDISKLSQEQQHKLLELLKKKRDELNKKSGGDIKKTSTIFDVDELDDKSGEGDGTQEGGTRKISF
jgi:DNA-directed RNA polymerase II subunit RPB2